MPITWRNIDAPDFSSAAGIMQQGSQNIQGALNNLAGMAQQKVADDTAANTAALMEGIRQNVTDTASYDAFDLNQAAQQYGQYANKSAALDMLLGLRPSFQAIEDAKAANAATVQAAQFKAQSAQDRWAQEQLLGVAKEKSSQIQADVDYQLRLALDKPENSVPVEFEPEDDPTARTSYREQLENNYKDAAGEWMMFGDKSGQALMRDFDKYTTDFDRAFKKKYGTVAPTSLIRRIMAELPKTEDGRNIQIKKFNEVKDRIMATYAPPPENYTRRKQLKQEAYTRKIEAQKAETARLEKIIRGEI